jgi:serine/threonine protein kinase
MFLDEARVCALLTHQNLTSVFEVDVDPITGQHFIAMEYVHGVDLRELLAACAREHQLLPYDVALSIVAAAAAGLDHAHRRCGPDGRPLRLVHRDVSLSNIMIGHDGSVKVVDFGIATTAIATVHTSPGVVRGKASYMSPEQCLGDRVDHLTDVFALGIVLYELTTGMRCFHGKSDFERMLAVVRGDYIPPQQIIHDFPLELAEVIRTALSTNASQRYSSAAALIEAIEQVMAGHGWTTGPTTIAKLMQDLFGGDLVDLVGPSPAAPQAIATADATAKEAPRARRLENEGAEWRREIIVDTADVVAVFPSASRVARGTNSDGYVPDDDDDQPTRGRRVLRRPPFAQILAA